MERGTVQLCKQFNVNDKHQSFRDGNKQTGVTSFDRQLQQPISIDTKKPND